MMPGVLETMAAAIANPADMSRPEKVAFLAAEGSTGHATTAATFLAPSHGEMDFGMLSRMLDKQMEQARKGNLGHLEMTLAGQAIALNAIFHEMARRAAANMGQAPREMERYMRLAMKAQSQCRCTVETLAEIKNPRQVAFVTQANIAQNQQVNNAAPPRARTGRKPSTQNKLLEAEASNVERLDTRAQGTSVRGYPPLEAVAKVHRAKVDRRKAAGQP